MAERARRLEWQGFRNARDLGGLPSASGETSFRALVRSELPESLTRAGLAAVEEYGIRTVVDLRSSRELRERPSPLRTLEGYVNVPLLDDADMSQVSDLRDMGAIYQWQADNRGARFAAVLDAIAGAPAGGVLFHCHAGKDRTGNVAALALEVAGVGREAIVGDYVMTEGTVPYEFRPLPELMRGLLHHLDARYGGVASYLESHGLGRDAQRRLRARLSERDRLR